MHMFSIIRNVLHTPFSQQIDVKFFHLLDVSRRVIEPLRTGDLDGIVEKEANVVQPILFDFHELGQLDTFFAIMFNQEGYSF